MSKRLTMNDVVLGGLKRRARQNALLVLGVMLSVFFLSVSVFGASCIVKSTDEYYKNAYGEADVVLMDVRDAPIDTLVSEGILKRCAVEELLYQSVGDAATRDDDFVVARLSEEVTRMMRVRLREGELPDAPGEIALEAAALARSRTNAAVGDEIELTLMGFDGEKMLSQTASKRFTLVGVLVSTGSALNGQHVVDGEYVLLTHVAEAYVSSDEPLIPGMREVRTVLGEQAPGARANAIANWRRVNTPFKGEYEFDTRYLYNYDGLFGGGEGGATLWALIVVFAALTAVAMTGIASALTASVDRRKNQIGMLRAIGATASQVRALLLRETLLIAGASLVPGVSMAALLLWGVHLLYPEYVVFNVPLWLAAMDAAVCGACVMLCALLPVRRSTRITPMQAVRDVDLTRRFRWKGETSRERFVPQRLLARRCNALRPGRTALMTLLVGAGALLFTGAFGIYANMLRSYASVSATADYTVNNVGFSMFAEGLVNERFYESRLTAGDKAEILAIPGVARVESAQEATVCLLMDGFTDYITAGGMDSGYSYLYKEPAPLQTALWNAGYYKSTTFADLQLAAAKRHEIYRANMNALGWEGEAVTQSIQGLSAGLLESAYAHVLEGEIRPDKLASGEEVLVCPRADYAVRLEIDPDLTGYGTRTVIADNARAEDGPIYRNDVFFAGRDMRMGFAWSRGEAEGERSLPAEWEAFTRTVKIGAVLDSSFGYGTIVTSEAGLLALGIDANYTELQTYLVADTDSATRDYVAERVEDVVRRAPDAYFRDEWEEAEAARRSQIVFLGVGAMLLMLLFAFSWAILNSAVAGSVRSDVRQIGTMRAVGASKRAIFSSYATRLYRVFLLGGSVGWALGAATVFLLLYYPYRVGWFWRNAAWDCLTAPIYLMPLLGLCLLGVRRKLKPVFRSSVVENIRIL